METAGSAHYNLSYFAVRKHIVLLINVNVDKKGEKHGEKNEFEVSESLLKRANR